jgi:2-aminoadipate transaminase
MAKQAGDLCSSVLDQRIVYEAARQGILERQLPMLRRHYQDKRDVLIEALKRELGDDIRGPDPRGGFFLWATLPPAIDADRMLARAVEHGVVYVAGSAFFVNNGGRNLIRLSFSAPSHERLRDGAVRLATAIREELAVPAAPEPRASTRR